MNTNQQALAAMYQRLVEIDGYKWQANYEILAPLIFAATDAQYDEAQAWATLLRRGAELGAAFALFENARDEYARVKKGGPIT